MQKLAKNLKFTVLKGSYGTKPVRHGSAVKQGALKLSKKVIAVHINWKI